MPSRKRSREAAKARRRAELEAEGIDPDERQRTRRGKKRRRSARKRAGSAGNDAAGATGSSGRRPRTGPPLDPSASDNAEVRFVMAADAVKTYRCPGCNRHIPAGVGHLVAVPPEAPDLRRHWHRGCWENRNTRI
ncbi:MAG: ATP/GTP-binding protein [Acidimicrobiia bacterium]|nr:ATP/GTP-binding protein [Acidimicrobiia bacterium]